MFLDSEISYARFVVTEQENLMRDIYLSNVKTIETMSEATLQLALNGMVMKEFGIEYEEWYGIEYSIQVISAALSIISIYKCLADRFSFINNGKDLGPVSKDFLKGMVDLAIPILTYFLLMIVTWSAPRIPSEYSLTLVIIIHPIVAFSFILLDRIFKAAFKTFIFESYNMLTIITCVTMLIWVGIIIGSKYDPLMFYNPSEDETYGKYKKDKTALRIRI